MSALQTLLASFREQTQNAAYQGRRDQGTVFENLMVAYFQTEPCYKELYQNVQPYGTWAAEHLNELDLGGTTDAGIDLVATTFTGEYHAIQCKNYAPDHTLQKKDIDSFFTASGKTHFSNRIIVSTTDKWSKNADSAKKARNRNGFATNR